MTSDPTGARYVGGTNLKIVECKSNYLLSFNGGLLLYKSKNSGM